MTTAEEKYSKEMQELEILQKDIQTLIKAKEQYSASFLENKMVLEELDLVKNGAKVFKLVGPVLVNKDLEEAQSEVKERIQYMVNESKNIETRIEKAKKLMDDHKEKAQSLEKRVRAEKQAAEES